MICVVPFSSRTIRHDTMNLRNILRACLLAAVVALSTQGVGCKSQSANQATPSGAPTAGADDEVNVENKFDAALRMRIRTLATTDPEARLSCFIELDAPVDDQKRQQLEEAGLRVRTVVDQIVTVEGTPGALRRAAAYPFVRSVSLSQTRPPKQQ